MKLFIMNLRLRPIWIFASQIVDVNNQSHLIILNHVPYTTLIDALIFLKSIAYISMRHLV